ncbi:Fe-S oxidoreductase [Synergistales bacterium]|nr:Fe-S oxidoreductase [Synergistales bacterium]
MDEKNIASKIADHAVSLGFERCGIIGVDAMKGYADKINERVARFPETGKLLRSFTGFADLREEYPWAKSVVICSRALRGYRVPAALNGAIGKHYLMDVRRDKATEGYRANAAFEKYMASEFEMRTASRHDRGITACRWAAMSAGIGVIRRNNFFYGDHGSYYTLTAFLIDRELRHTYVPSHKACPDNCNLCVKNCPTASLAEPYAMCAFTCASFLTNKCQDEAAFNAMASKLGGMLYGCDACQDACPFNKGQWVGDQDFPGLDEFADMTPEKILASDDEYLRKVVSPKFWYIAPEDVWMWKRNATNAMRNNPSSAT